MNLVADYKIDIALLFIRIVLGVLFFFQAYDKIFGLGLKQSEQGVAEALHETKLSPGFIKMMVGLSAFVELIGGLLLVLGLFIYPSLVFLGLDLLIVVVAMSLKEPLWDMRFVWPRFILLIALLVFPLSADRISFDHFLHFYESSPILAGA
jgi:uncharacterized membrane protein YphA (DoxX/SURF4 family)